MADTAVEIKSWRELQGKPKNEVAALLESGQLDAFVDDKEFHDALKGSLFAPKPDGATAEETPVAEAPKPDVAPKPPETPIAEPEWKKEYATEEAYKQHQSIQDELLKTREKLVQQNRAFEEKNREWTEKGRKIADMERQLQELNARIASAQQRTVEQTHAPQPQLAVDIPDFVPPEGDQLAEGYAEKMNKALRDHAAKQKAALTLAMENAKKAESRAERIEKELSSIRTEMSSRFKDVEAVREEVTKNKVLEKEQREKKALEDTYSEIDSFVAKNPDLRMSKSFRDMDSIYIRTGGQVDGIISKTDQDRYHAIMGLVDMYIPKSEKPEGLAYDFTARRNYKDLDETYLIHLNRTGKLAEVQAKRTQQAASNAAKATESAIETARDTARMAPSHEGADAAIASMTTDQMQKRVVEIGKLFDSKTEYEFQHPSREMQPLISEYNAICLKLGLPDSCL